MAPRIRWGLVAAGVVAVAAVAAGVGIGYALWAEALAHRLLQEHRRLGLPGPNHSRT